MTTPPTTPAPADDFDRAHHARTRRTRARRLLVAVPGTVAAFVLAIALRQVELYWPLPVAMIVAMVAAVYCLVVPDPPERPMPDTRLELGRVVSSRITKLGGRGPDAVNRVMMIIEPLDGSGILLHGETDLPTSESYDLPAGTVVGFRRHPTTRHLVRLEEKPPRVALVAAATAGDDRVTEHSASGAATVTGVTVGTGLPDGRWEVEVALSLADGRPGRARCLIPPEMLVALEPGTALSVVHRDESDGPVVECLIRFPTGNRCRDA